MAALAAAAGGRAVRLEGVDVVFGWTPSRPGPPGPPGAGPAGGLALRPADPPPEPPRVPAGLPALLMAAAGRPVECSAAVVDGRPVWLCGGRAVPVPSFWLAAPQGRRAPA